LCIFRFNFTFDPMIILLRFKRFCLLAVYLVLSSAILGQWTAVTIPTTDHLKSLQLVSSTSWYVSTANVFWKTGDAGLTWTSSPFVDAGGNVLPMVVNDIHFTSATVGFATGLYSNGAVEAILRTQNGGTSWAVVHTGTAGMAPRELMDIDFVSTNSGTAVGRGGRILHTTNGGTNWTEAGSLQSQDLFCIDYGSSSGHLGGNGVWGSLDGVGGSITYYNSPDTVWSGVLSLSSAQCRLLGNGDISKTSAGQVTTRNFNLPDIRKIAIPSTNHTIYLAERVWVRRSFFNQTTVQHSLPDLRFNDIRTLSSLTVIVGDNGSIYTLTGFGDMPPQFDAHLQEMVPIPSYNCAGNAVARARIFNTGQDSIFSSSVAWSIDGVQQPGGFFTDTIAPGTSKTVTVATINNFTTDDHLIEGFLTSVNGIQDPYPVNDTDRYQWRSSVMSGLYTVGGTNPDFFGLQNALSAVRLRGTCDSVIFELRDGNTTLTTIDNSLGAIAPNASIRIRPESGNAGTVTITSNAVTLSNINNLFFENVTLTSSNTNVIAFAGVCNNVHFNNCVINGGSSGTGAMINSAVGTCGDFYINNCTFNGGVNALQLLGTASDPFGDIIVRDCVFAQQSSISVRVSNALRAEVTGTTITNAATATTGRGVELNMIRNDYRIENCRITMLNGRGIGLSDNAQQGGNGRVVNNRIITGTTGGSSVGDGIRIEETRSLLLAHNSVTTYGNSGGNPLVVYVSDLSFNWGVNMHNNIFACYTGLRPAFFDDAANVTFDNLGLAYTYVFESCSGNVWHSSGGSGISYFGQPLSDAEAWKAMVSIDSTSRYFNPEFALDNVVPLWGNKNYLLHAMVPALPEVPEDRQGSVRSAFTEPGCDELQLPSSDLRIVNTANYPAICVGENDLIYRVAYAGTEAIAGFEYTYTINGEPQSAEYMGLMNSGDTVEVVVPVVGETGEPYTVMMEVAVVAGEEDGNPFNNSVTESFQVTGLSGIYQVGGEDPNFASIAAAINSLSAGICGDVIFEIQPGVYTEAVVIPASIYTGVDRTITLRGVGAEPSQVLWRANTSSSANYVCQLNGIDYLTIENLSIETIGTGTSLDMLVFQNGSTFNTICNVDFIGKTTSRAIVSTTTGNDHSNTVDSCYFHRGGTSITWQAPVGGERNNRFSNNFFFDQRSNILLSFQDGLVFENNVLESDTANSGAASLGGLLRMRISGNRVLGSFTAGLTVSNTVGGAGGQCLVDNNEIIVNGSGNGSGLSVSCDNAFVLHNSVHNQKIEGGVAFAAVTETDMVIVGNVFVSEYGTAATSVAATGHFRDYNVLWCIGENIQTGVSGSLTSIQSNEQEWNSRYYHPVFASATDLRTPNDAVLDNFVSSAFSSGWIGVDRLGAVRSFPSDAGCYSYTPAAVSNNSTITSLTLNSDMCPGTAPLGARIKNSGTNVLQSVAMDWRINGSEWQNVILPLSLNPQQESDVNVSIVDWTGGVDYDIELRITGVNGSSDEDTTGNRYIRHNLRTRFGGQVFVGPGNDLETPFEMALRLREQGMCAPTEVIIATGEYADFLYLDEIEGSSSVNTLTLRSETHDYHDVIINNGGSAAVQFDDSAVWLEGTDNILFEGLTLATTGWNHLDFSVNGIGDIQNITFRNCFLNEGLHFSDISVSGFIMDSCKVTNKRTSLGQTANDVLIRRSSFDSDRCVYIANVHDLVFDKNTLLHDGFTDQNYDGLNVVNGTGNIRITNNVLNGRFYHGFKLLLFCNENNPALVANNVITGNHEFYSLRLDNGENVDIVHNTVQNTEINPVPFYTYYFGIGLTGDNIRVLNNSVVLNEYYESGFFGISGINNLIDYNNFYGNLPVEMYPQILAERQAQGYDLNTTVIDPQFFSLNVLIPQNPLILNTGTAFPSVTHDIMGRERNVTSPTIGAYETSDLLPVNVDSLTKDLQLLGLVNDTLVIGTNVLSVEVINSNTFIPELQDVNFGGVVDTIYFTYKVNHRPLVTELWTGSLESGDTLTYVFNTPVDITKGMLYDIETTVTLGSRFEEFDFENNRIEDRILMPMAGEYLVDSLETADFLSLYEAQESRYYCGGNGIDTIFLQLAPGQHLGGMWQSPLVGISNDYPTVVESTTGVREDVWVHFNDAYEVGFITFRNIVLTPVAPADFSPNFGGSIKFTTCGDIHFDNVLFTGPSYTNFYTGLELVACYHTTISNCEFRQLRNGVDWSSTENYGLNYFYEDQELRNCTINVTNNGVNYGGSQFSGNLTIEDCTIYGGNVGVNLDPDPFLRGDIRRNSIRGGSRSMSVSGTSNQNLRIYNNFILASPLTSLRILTGGLNGPTVLHNSIVGGVVLDGTAGFTFVNNAVVAGQGAALVVDSPVAFDPTEWNVSNNAYYRSSPGNIVVYSINNGQDVTTLDAIFQTFGLESASIVANPYFFSAGDLHANAPELNNTGVYRSEVPDDIDLQERSASTPDIGADEFDVQWASGDIVVQEVVVPENICPGAFPVQVVVQNNSDGVLSYLQVEISVDGTPLPVDFWQGELPAGESDTLQVGEIALEAGAAPIIEVTAQPTSAFFSDEPSNNITPPVELHTGLSGTITIGAGGVLPSFASFQQAIDDDLICGDISLVLVESLTDEVACVYTGSDQVDLTIAAAEGVVIAAPLLVENWTNIFIDSLLIQGFTASIIATDTLSATIAADHAMLSFQASEVNITNSQLDSSQVSIVCDHVVFSNNIVSGYNASFGNTGVEIELIGAAGGEVSANLFDGGSAPLTISNAASLDCVNNRFLQFETNALTLLNSSARVLFNTFYSEESASVALVTGDSDVTGMNNIMYSARVLTSQSIVPQLDYNVYFTSAETPFVYGVNEFTDLSTWQSFTSGDLNSEWLDAGINELLGAEYSNPALNGSGIYYTEFPVDAIGRVRSNPPAPGAMESNPQPAQVNFSMKNLEIVDVMIQQPTVGDNTVEVRFTLNDAYLPVTPGVVYQGAVDSVWLSLTVDDVSIYSNWYTGTLDFNDTLTVTLEDIWQIPVGMDYLIECTAGLSPLYSEVNYADNVSALQIILPMEGQYTVAFGSHPIFSSLDEAHTALGLCGMAGDVEFLIGTINTSVDQSYTSDDSYTLTYLGMSSSSSVWFTDGIELENIVFRSLSLDSAMYLGQLRSVVFDQCVFNSSMQEARIEAVSDVIISECTIHPLQGGFVIQNIAADNALVDIFSNTIVNEGASFQVLASEHVEGMFRFRSNNVSGSVATSVLFPFGADSVFVHNNNLRSEALVLELALSESGSAKVWNNVFQSGGTDALHVNAGGGAEVLFAFNNLLGTAVLEGAGRWDVVNNIFTSNDLAVMGSFPGWEENLDRWNYNNVWSYSEAVQSVEIEVLGVQYTSMNAMHGAAGFDVNGWQVDPLYLALSNLQTSNTVLSAQGVAVSGIFNDALDQPRANPPSIGAYETVEGGVPTDVWPGDTNDDFSVNLFDALPVIYHNGSSGSERLDASLAWEGQPAYDWPALSFQGDNLKWVDANGDGVIAPSDTMAIAQNFGALRSSGGGDQSLAASIAGTLVLVADQAEWLAGEWVSFQLILNTTGNDATDLRAIAVRLQLPLEIVSEGTVEWTSEGTGFPSSPTILRMQAYDATSGTLELALGSLTDPISLNGVLAHLRFRVSGDVQDEMSASVIITDHTIVNGVGENETVATVDADGSVVPIGIARQAQYVQWRVVPNPSVNDPVLYGSGSHGSVELVRVITAEGKTVWQQRPNVLLTSGSVWRMEGVSSLPSGMYMVEITTSDGRRATVRWIKV
jgi:hypothetical protein